MSAAVGTTFAAEFIVTLFPVFHCMPVPASNLNVALFEMSAFLGLISWMRTLYAI